jgi:hypothetical protein
MKISERTIKRLGEIITGNKHVSAYRSGLQLVRFFNEFGTIVTSLGSIPPHNATAGMAPSNSLVFGSLASCDFQPLGLAPKLQSREGAD